MDFNDLLGDFEHAAEVNDFNFEDWAFSDIDAHRIEAMADHFIENMGYESWDEIPEADRIGFAERAIESVEDGWNTRGDGSWNDLLHWIGDKDWDDDSDVGSTGGTSGAE